MNEKPLNLKLRNALFLHGYSQTKLAEKTRIPRQYISGNIHGHWRLREDQKKTIADVLGEPVQELFDELAQSQ